MTRYARLMVMMKFFANLCSIWFRKLSLWNTAHTLTSDNVYYRHTRPLLPYANHTSTDYALYVVSIVSCKHTLNSSQAEKQLVKGWAQLQLQMSRFWIANWQHVFAIKSFPKTTKRKAIEAAKYQIFANQLLSNSNQHYKKKKSQVVWKK